MRQLLSVIFSWFFSLAVFAQADLRIHATVLDDRTDEPIPLAGVRLFQYEQQHAYAVTDFEGAVTFDQLALSRYELVVEYNGYITFDTVIYTVDDSLDFTIYLRPSDASVEPVTIVTYQVPLLALSGPYTSYVPNSLLTNAGMPLLMPLTSAPIVSSAVGFDPYYCIDHNEGHWQYLDSLKSPSTELVIFSADGKQGVSDENGKVIIEPFYNSIRQMRGIEVYRFLVQKDHHFGLMNEHGEWIIPCKYDQIFSMTLQLSCIHKRHLLLVVKDEKFGLITTNGDVICPPVYDFVEVPSKTYVCPAQPHLMRVKKDSKYGCLDQDGNLVVPVEYDSIGVFDYSPYALTIKDGKQGVIYEDGSVFLAPVYDSCSIKSFSELVLVQQNKKWGVVNDSAQLIIPMIYDEMRIEYTDEVLFFVRVGRYWGVLDESGNERFKPQFDGLEIIHPDGALMKYKKGTKFGTASADGTILQPAELDEVKGYGVTYYYRIGTKWGFLSGDGSTRTAPLFDRILESDYEFCNVRKGSLYGVCDNSGNLLIKPLSEKPFDLYELYYYGRCVYEKAGKYGLVGVTDSILIKPLYDESFFDIYVYDNPSLFVNMRNGKQVLIRSDGTELIGPYYDNFYAHEQFEDYFVVENNERYGLIAPTGRKVCDPVYTSIGDAIYIRHQDHPAFIVTKETGTGIIDSAGKTVIPFVYDLIRYYSDSTLSVRRNDSTAVIDHYGKVLMNFSPYEFHMASGAVTIVSDQSKYGLMDASGELLCPVIYSRIEEIYPGSLFKIYQGINEGILKADGTELIPPVYENVKCYSADFYAVKKDGLYGFMDSTGTLTVDYQFEKVKDVSGNRVVVRRQNKFGIVDQSGSELLRLMYDYEIDLYRFREQELVSLSSNGKYGLIRSDLTTVLSPVYGQPIQKIRGDRYQVVSRNKLWGVLDSSYTESVPCMYPSLDDYHGNGIFVVTVDLKSGLISRTNETILPCVYELITSFRYSNGTLPVSGYIVRKGMYFAIYDSLGKPLTEFEFDAWKEWWNPEMNAYIDVVQKNGKWYRMNGEDGIVEIP